MKINVTDKKRNDSGNVVGEYAYDAFGRRVKKVASGITTLYHYAGGNLIAETDQYGNMLRNYIYLVDRPGGRFGCVKDLIKISDYTCCSIDSDLISS